MFMTNERTLLYGLYAMGAVVWYVLWMLFRSVVELTLPMQSLGPIPLAQLTAIVALAISFAAVQLVWRNQKAKEYGVDVVVETKKVSWPNRKELQGATIIVVVMVLVTTIIIFGFDKVLDYLVKLVF
jgi:preprotein translocase subunit SecE